MSDAKDARPARRRVLGMVGAVLAGPLVDACSSSSTPSATTSGPSSSADASPSTPGGSSSASNVTRELDPAGPDITHGPRSGSGVALTFHGAGDPRILQRMLAELKAGGAHVTVLAIGQWLAGQPTIARHILDGGHELGNHTWSHQTMPRLSPTVATSEVEKAADELRKLTGSKGRWFRPSGTPSSTATIRQAALKAGYGACLGYDVDPMDNRDPGTAIVLSRLESKLRPGSIVSLHLGHAGTVAAMPQILSLIHARGLRPVTVSTLLQE